jgi:methyl-accepting chemotaxis protein
VKTKKGSGLKSLSVKMILSMGAVVLAICSILGYVSYVTSRNALKDNIDQSMLEIADEASSTIYLRVNSQIENMQTLVQNDRFYDVNNQSNIERIKELLTTFAKKNNNLNMVVTDISGKGYSLKSDNMDLSSWDFFKSAVKGNNVVTDPMNLDGYEDLVIIYSIPIRNESNQICGTITTVNDGYELCDFISDFSFGKDSYAYMKSRTGKNIAHSTTKSLVNGETASELAITDDSYKELAALDEKLIAGGSGIGEYTYMGVTRYVAYCPIEGTNWSLGVAAPKDNVMEGLTPLTNKIVNTSIAFFILGIAVAVLVSSYVARPIRTAAAHAYNFATGDFTQELPEKLLKRKDEIGLLADSFKQLGEGMNELLINVKTASDQVASGAKQISDSSMLLSQGATEQASSLEELTASIEEISTQTKLNAENADNANKIAFETQELANVGNDQMKHMLNAMDNINTSSKSISKIIKVIDDIAFQTNILALNAAVEAARAGQAGKGFAVVAQEVRNLAAKSAAAAKETTELIESSINKVNDGSKIANETAEQLKKIVTGISQAADIVSNISVSSNEQASAISQVNQGIMQVSQVVQVNSSTSEEGAAASEELSGQAAMLKEHISKFKLKNDTSNDKRNPPVKLEVSEPEKSVKKNKEIKISLSDMDFGKY